MPASGHAAGPPAATAAASAGSAGSQSRATKRRSVTPSEASEATEATQRALLFLKRTRSELRTLRKVHVWPDRLGVFDVNGDWFEIRGVGYESPEIIALLDAVNAVYKRQSIHEPFAKEYKEFLTGRRYAWGADRVM